MAKNSQNSTTVTPGVKRLASGVTVAFTRNLWQECLDDCVGDEREAQQLYDKIMRSIERQYENKKFNVKRRRLNQPQAGDAESIASRLQLNTDSEAVNASSHNKMIIKSGPQPMAYSEPDANADATNLKEEDDDEEEKFNGSQGECDSITLSLPQSDLESNSESEVDAAQTCRRRLEWCRPGELSSLVGVSHSVLRNWAKMSLVQTMVSAKGHRLYNVKSVKQHINKSVKKGSRKNLKAASGPGASKSSEVQLDTLSECERQMIVFMRLNSTIQDQAQLDAAGQLIKEEVMRYYKDECTPSELASCLIVIELESDAVHNKRVGSGPTSQYLTDTPGTRRLLKTICNRGPRRSLVVLRAAEDISSAPSTYALFLLMCRNMGATVQVVPELLLKSANDLLTQK